MKAIFLIILPTTSFQYLFAQTKLPIFQSQQDSTDHVTITKLINDQFMECEKVNGKKVDSLMTLRTAIAKRITGYRWKNMYVLYLANNKLPSLPDNMGDLKSLGELYLHHNGISVIPESTGKLQELRILRINQNHLNTLPESLD